MTATKISFIRHGHAHNPDGVYYGRLPGFSLSQQGRIEARAVADHMRLAPLAAIFSSPLQRALETAKPLADYHPDLTVQLTDQLNEVYTPYDGQPTTVLEARNWDGYTGSAPVFEQPDDVLQRIKEFVTKARVAYAGQHVAAITHGDVIAFLIMWAKRQPLNLHTKSILYQICLRPGSITTLTFGSDLADTRPRLAYSEPGD